MGYFSLKTAQQLRNSTIFNLANGFIRKRHVSTYLPTIEPTFNKISNQVTGNNDYFSFLSSDVDEQNNANSYYSLHIAHDKETVIFENCNFEDCVANGFVMNEIIGGAFFCQSCNVSITNSIFYDCCAVYGGAFGTYFSNLFIQGCNFTKNTALEDIGALWSMNNEETRISHCIFEQNTAQESFGAICINSSKNSIEFCNFYYNSGQLSTDVAFLSYNENYIQNCNFKLNTSNPVFYSESETTPQTINTENITLFFENVDIGIIASSYGSLTIEASGYFCTNKEISFKKEDDNSKVNVDGTITKEVSSIEECLLSFYPPEQTPLITPFNTPEITPFETPYTTPVGTLDQTPIETVQQTPLETPISSPEITPYKTMFQTAKSTPLETPQFTEEYTPIQTPHYTEENTPIQTPSFTFYQTVQPTEEISEEASSSEDEELEEEELPMSLGGGLGLGLLLLLLILIIIIVIICCCKKKERRGCCSCYLCAKREKDDSPKRGKYHIDPKRDVFVIQIEDGDDDIKNGKNPMILNPKFKVKGIKEYLV